MNVGPTDRGTRVVAVPDVEPLVTPNARRQGSIRSRSTVPTWG
jgi:hypothetical protein